MPNAKLSKERIDGAYLYALSPAGISQFGRMNVILALRYHQGECGEPLHDGIPSFRARETLKQFLQDQTCGEDRLACLKRSFEKTDLGTRWWSVSS